MANKRTGAAALIFDDAGRILLVKHTYGRLNWELPGGNSEAAESISGTAVRETFEETGLRVVAEKLIGIYYRSSIDPRSHTLPKPYCDWAILRPFSSAIVSHYCRKIGDVHALTFLCRPVDTDRQPKPSSPEISECRFWPVDALPRPMSNFTELRIKHGVLRVTLPDVIELEPLGWLD